MIFQANRASDNGIIPQDYNVSDKDQTKTLKALIIACMLYGISIGTNLSTFSLFLRKFGLNSDQVTNTLSFELIGNLLIAPWIMFLSARTGFIKLMLNSLFIRNISLIIFALGTTKSEWIIGMIGFGIGGGALYIGIFQWINLIADYKHRATYLAIIYTALYTGITTGSYIISQLDVIAGVESCLISVGVSSLMFIPLFIAKRWSDPKYIFKKISFDKLFVWAKIPILAGICYNFISYSFSTFLSFYGVGVGMLQEDAYLLTSYFYFAGIIFTIPLGIIIDKVNRVWAILIASIISLLTLQILPHVTDDHYLMLATLMVLRISFSTLIITSLAIIGDKFTGNSLVAAMSTIYAMNTIGGFAGVTATGYTIQLIGEQGLIFSTSSVFLVFLVYLISGILKNKK